MAEHDLDDVFSRPRTVTKHNPIDWNTMRDVDPIIERAALPMRIQNTAHLEEKARLADETAEAMRYATTKSGTQEVATLYRQFAACRAGVPPMSRFLSVRDSFHSARKYGVGPVDYSPGSEAPEDGTYEQFDVFRIPTGITERVVQGERLPLAPQGYTWRKAADSRATSGA